MGQLLPTNCNEPSMVKGWTIIKIYGIATTATALVSVSHLLLQLVVLNCLSSKDFGLVSFVMTLFQFGTGICNALVAAPYTVISAKSDKQQTVIDSFFLIDLIIAGLIAVLTGLSLAAIGQESAAATLLFALASAFSSIRWFGRTYAYNRNQRGTAASSDLIYAIVLTGGLLVAWLVHLSLAAVALVFLSAAICGILPFGTAFIALHLRWRNMNAFSAYGSVWRCQARWALLGLVTTEATTNSHTYIVTFLAGPTAFAPLAAAMLFLRPIGVCIVSLTNIERPALARALAAGLLNEAAQITSRFTSVLMVIALGTMFASAAVLHLIPELVVKPGMNRADVIAATAIWSAIMLVTCFQAPRNVLLQAASRFRGLAMASICSCGVTVVAVTLLLYFAGPVYSALGVLAGQLGMTAGINMQSRFILANRANILLKRS